MEPVGAFNFILLLGGFLFVMFMISLNRKDAEKRAEAQETKEDGMDSQYLPVLRPYNDVSSWSQPLGSYGYPLAASSPETQLAETHPALAARLLAMQSVSQTHDSVAGPVVLELARQGNTRITATTYQTTSIFGKPGIVTRIKASRR